MIEFNFQKYEQQRYSLGFRPMLLLDGEKIPYLDEHRKSTIRVSTVCRFPDVCTQAIGWTARAQLKKLTQMQEAKAQIRADVQRGREIEHTTEKRYREIQEEIEEIEDELEELEPEECARAKRQLEPKRQEAREIREAKERIHSKVEDRAKDVRSVEKSKRRLSSAAHRGRTAHEVRQTAKIEEAPPGLFIADFTKPQQTVSQCIRDWKRNGKGRVFDFPTYGKYEDMAISGHPDFVEVDENGVVFLEEWKPHRDRDYIWDNYFRQVGLYKRFLSFLFNDDFPAYISTYDRDRYAKSDLRALLRNPAHVSDEVVQRVLLQNSDAMVEEALESAYKFFTAQTPCQPVTSGLCKRWCPWRWKCEYAVKESSTVTEKDGEIFINWQTGKEHVNYD